MYILLKILNILFSFIPRKIGYLIFEFFGILLFHLNKKKRENLKKNLSYALNSNISDTLLKKIFKNYARYYFDLFQEREKLIPFTDKEKFSLGAEVVKNFIEKYGGCIIASLHIGNWDYGGAYLSYLFPGKVNVVVEKLSKDVFKWFKETREKWGMKVIESNDIKSMLKVLKSSEILVLLIDRDLDKTGFKLELFGKKAFVPSGPAKIALKAKVPIMFAGMLRNQINPLYFYPFYSQTYLNLDLLERNDENILKITKQLINHIEEQIKKNPEQWCMLQDIWCE